MSSKVLLDITGSASFLGEVLSLGNAKPRCTQGKTHLHGLKSPGAEELRSPTPMGDFPKVLLEQGHQRNARTQRPVRQDNPSIPFQLELWPWEEPLLPLPRPHWGSRWAARPPALCWPEGSYRRRCGAKVTASQVHTLPFSLILWAFWQAPHLCRNKTR